MGIFLESDHPDCLRHVTQRVQRWQLWYRQTDRQTEWGSWDRISLLCEGTCFPKPSFNHSHLGPPADTLTWSYFGKQISPSDPQILPLSLSPSPLSLSLSLSLTLSLSLSLCSITFLIRPRCDVPTSLACLSFPLPSHSHLLADLRTPRSDSHFICLFFPFPFPPK